MLSASAEPKECIQSSSSSSCLYSDSMISNMSICSNHYNIMSQVQVTSTEFQDEPHEPAANPIPDPTNTPAQGGSKLNQNFYQRLRTTVYMIVGFAVVLSAGQFYSSLAILFLSFMIFSEINGIKRNEEKEVKIPMTKFINWYIFLAYNYYMLGRFISGRLPYLGMEHPLVGRLLNYHSFICFSLFLIGFLSFVLSLRQGFLKYQFRLFGWIVIATLLIASPAWCMISNTYEGLIFFILPSMLIVVNDIFAYVFGYFLGRHPMIALSPKKTWEGYIGGAISTCLFSIILTSALQSIDGIACPSTSLSFVPFVLPNCDTHLLESITLGPLVISQLQAHFMLFSLFASTIGPFGGFFASGLKRSIKIKDFANSIPGHGGVSDRMDCQLIMGSFVYFYQQTFIKNVAAGTAAYVLGLLSPNEQLSLYNALGANLQKLGLIAV